jgi:two-component system, sensor histidine kinase RegB
MRTPALAELETTLYWLRWVAVGGQAGSLWFAHAALDLQLPWPRLIAGVVLLAAGNAWFAWRRSRAVASEPRVLLGLALDLAALTWALFHSGGVMNPFTMLYLLPVALAAVVLPPSRVLAIVLAGLLGYAVLLLWAPPLPHLHGQGALDLHLTGMTVNFLISMAVLCAFGLYLARLLRRNADALRSARERGLRDEGMHALALQAAVAAHSVNTPLATMALLVDELRAALPAGAALEADLALLARQLGCARDALRGLVEAARTTRPAPLARLLAELAERAALLRPAVPLALHVAPEIAGRAVSLPPVLLASLGNLLDNAADASHRDPDAGIELFAEGDAEALSLRVLDRGCGIGAAPPPGFSDKPDGLGWGLALTNATLELHGGELYQRLRPGGGCESRVRLPWAVLQGEP